MKTKTSGLAHFDDGGIKKPRTSDESGDSNEEREIGCVACVCVCA